MVVSNSLRRCVECLIWKATLPWPEIKKPINYSVRMNLYMQDVTRFTTKHLVCEALAAKKELEACSLNHKNLTQAVEEIVDHMRNKDLPTVYNPYIPKVDEV